MLFVGQTGGIGAGKSTVVNRLVGLGAVLIDSDRIAREVLEPGTDGLRAVTEEFGDDVVAADGTLDRAALASRVFADEAARERLNAIVHPRVRARSAELQAEVPADAVVVQDIPLLVEGGMAAEFPLVVVVHADVETRVRRVVDARDTTEQDVRARIAAQATDEQRRAVADVWLDNSGSRDRTRTVVDALWHERLRPFERNLREGRRAPRPAQPVLVPADAAWSDEAARLTARIAAVAGARARAHRVDHIGSTSVPGLDAKDVLDVQVVVADMPTARAVADDLLAAGLVSLDGEWHDNAADGSRLPKALAVNADPSRAVNCHVRPADSSAWRETLLLRDWLRAHPDGAREYAELKHRLAAQPWESIDAYADAKTSFVRSALRRAEAWAASR